MVNSFNYFNLPGKLAIAHGKLINEAHLESIRGQLPPLFVELFLPCDAPLSNSPIEVKKESVLPLDSSSSSNTTTDPTIIPVVNKEENSPCS